MKTKAIVVKPEQTEKMRIYLSKENLIRTDLKIKRKEGLIYIPLKEVNSKLKSHKIIDMDFEKNKRKPKSLQEVISIPKKLKKELPTSYDTIGNIILLKLKNDLLSYKEEIGKSLLTINKNIKTVCLIKPVEGEYRLRDIEIIAGENTTRTIHKEYGLKYEVDIKKTYFSPRLATERKRVADLVKPGEIIVDMFAGVAPFSITIAKYACPKIIYALDKNKFAIKYAKKNIKINNLLDKIEVIHCNAKNVKSILNGKEVNANRIIMNLPFSAHLYFKNSLEIADNYCFIHYYAILKEDKIKERIEILKKVAEEKRIILVKFDVRKIKTYAPREFYIGIDIKAKKNADVA